MDASAQTLWKHNASGHYFGGNIKTIKDLKSQLKQSEWLISSHNQIPRLFQTF